MTVWCHYSDMPSPQWWEKKWQLFRTVSEITREELHGELETIFECSTDEDLERLEVLVKKRSSENLLLIECDFIASKLKYFGKFPEGFTTSFGIDLELIPELVSKWRDTKLGNLGI